MSDPATTPLLKNVDQIKCCFQTAANFAQDGHFVAAFMEADRAQRMLSEIIKEIRDNARQEEG